MWPILRKMYFHTMEFNKYISISILITISLFASLTHAEQDNIATQFLNLSIEGDPFRVWFDKGKILYKQKDYKSAIEAFSKIGNDAPSGITEESSYLLANCLMQTGKYDEALSHAAAVSDRSRFYPFSLYTKAMINLRQGNGKSAHDDFDEIIKYKKPVLAQRVKQAGEKAEQIDEVELLIHRANLTLGFISLQKENHTEAIKYYSSIPKKSPFYDDSLFGLGWAYAQAGRWVRSVVFWEELTSVFPESPYSREVIPYLGHAYAELNAYGKAIEENGTALSYYRRMTASAADLRNKIQDKDIDKIEKAVNFLGNEDLSDSLTLYKGLLSMEEYIEQSNSGGSSESDSLIKMAKKRREAILDDVQSKAASQLDHLQQQFLRSSIYTTLKISQNLRLEGGGQISSDMIFLDND